MKIALAGTLAFSLLCNVVSAIVIDRQGGLLNIFEKTWHDDCFVKNNGKGTYWKMPSKYLCSDENDVTVAIMQR